MTENSSSNSSAPNNNNFFRDGNMLRDLGKAFDRLTDSPPYKEDTAMPTVFDVAQYIVDRMHELDRPLSTIKLQKLVYYSKAWSLAWDEDPLFPEEVQAWANGPVVPVLYKQHKGMFFSPEKFEGADPDKLTEEQKKTIELVIDSYGRKEPQYLVALSHSERPWRDARHGLEDYEIGNEPITDAAIGEYYSSLKI